MLGWGLQTGVPTCATIAFKIRCRALQRSATSSPHAILGAARVGSQLKKILQWRRASFRGPNSLLARRWQFQTRAYSGASTNAADTQLGTLHQPTTTCAAR